MSQITILNQITQDSDLDFQAESPNSEEEGDEEERKKGGRKWKEII